MTPLAIEHVFQIAVQHHQAGNLRQAATFYKQVLAQQPAHGDALHYLGLVAHQAGQVDVAVDLIRQALALHHTNAEAYNNLGNVLRDAGRVDEAIAACRQAIRLKPHLPEAFNNLGAALKINGQLDEAIAAYGRAIALKPQFAEPYNNLGIAMREKGQLDNAIAAYRQAIALQPGLSEVYLNLGNALKDDGRLGEAITAYREAIVVNPQYAEAHNNLGHALKERGQLEEAIAAYRQAIAVRPNYAEGYNNLGNALRDFGQLDEAISAYRDAIAYQPELSKVHSNLGNALREAGRLDEAISACRRAVDLKPDDAEGHSNLGNALADAGLVDDAIAAYFRAIALNPQLVAAHNNLSNAFAATGQLDNAIAACHRALAINPDYHEAHSNLVYTLHFHPGYDARAIAAEHRIWNRHHAQRLKGVARTRPDNHDTGRRLRIGYVSPDFREHPVGRFLLPLLLHHDKNAVEVFCYAQVSRPDTFTASSRRCADVWRSILGLSDESVAELIRQDQIDILVDLTMHMARNRLLVFARRPAPVQATYLAYCSSTGLETMDYRLSDPYLDSPAEDRSFYSEQTILLPETYWCYQPTIATCKVGPMPALERNFITFGCLNNFCKVNEPVLATWARILQAVPQSRLLVHAHDGNHRRGVLDRMDREGIDPSRLRFTGFMSITEYVDLYNRIDIALDTFPYAGGTTTCDALWMGVPVVSLAGKTAVGRGGLSLLSNIGLPELVARSEQAYVKIASDLANDLQRLSNLRAGLRQRMEQSPIMNAPRFARNIEVAYRQMWHTSGQQG